MKIAVAGATGRVGRRIAEVLTERAHEVVCIARSTGVDVISGAGLDAALTGVDVIVDAATGPSPEEQPATEFFVTAAHNMQEAGARSGVQRAVVVSIIGTDKSAGGYGAAKIAHERAWRSGPLPVTVLRAAQFHEFVGLLVDWGTQRDVAYVPEMRTQLVAARAVAEEAADLATMPNPPELQEIAGPREESMVAMATLLAARRGLALKVQGVRSPSDPDAELQATAGCCQARRRCWPAPRMSSGWRRAPERRSLFTRDPEVLDAVRHDESRRALCGGAELSRWPAAWSRRPVAGDGHLCGCAIGDDGLPPGR